MARNDALPGLCLKDVRTFLTPDGDRSDAIEALLRTHGVEPAATNTQIVPFDLCWRIFSDNAVLVKDETHAVFQERLRPGATGLMIARMLLSETLYGAFEAYAEACSVVVPDLAVSVRSRSCGVAVRWRTADPASELHHILLEGTVAVFYAIFCWMIGHPPQVLRVRAPVARRTSSSTLLQVMGAPVVFAGDDLEVLFSAEAAEARLRSVEVAGWRDGVYRELARLTLREEGAKRDGSAYAAEVRTALLDGVDQQAVAFQWGVSPKTVARRLEREGCSFRRIRDDLRMQRSAVLMRAGLTVEAIGEAVGYEDARSFRRAFRRWFGVSPSAYRLHQAAT